jgi:hypothetical protein
MPSKEIAKNRRDIIKVTPGQYHDHDLIDIRVYFPDKETGKLAPSRKGISVAVDLVPELIDALTWALGQPCDAEPESEERRLTDADADRLAQSAWSALQKHGSAVHWDSAEKMVLGAGLKEFTKWDLHYVLSVRKDLFERLDNGCFKARAKK